jgi:DNA invertase Pin-like site-specific DNA recombinase
MPLTATKTEPLSRAEFVAQLQYVLNARPDFKACFGVSMEQARLSGRPMWAAYLRQSTEEQSRNNRIVDYMLRCAELAKERGVIIPVDFIFYDAVTGKHFDRPALREILDIHFPRHSFAGIIIPLQERLSRNSAHTMEFERQADYYSIDYWYGDSPNGKTPEAKLMRAQWGLFTNYVLNANAKNNLGGRTSAITKGNVAAGKNPHGYIYHPATTGNVSKLTIDSLNTQHALSLPLALHNIPDINELTEYFDEGSPAHVAAVIFWLACRGQGSNKIAEYLNEWGVPTPRNAYTWHKGTIVTILNNTVYYGVGYYNKAHQVENPTRPLNSDGTRYNPKTIHRAKPIEEWFAYQVPAITTKEAWDLAQEFKTQNRKGKGRGKPSILRLLRGFIYCPECGHKMEFHVTRLKRNNGEVNEYQYYVCPPIMDRRVCGFRKNISADALDGIALEKLQQVLTTPQLLIHSANELLAELTTGVNGQDRIQHWQERVNALEGQIGKAKKWMNNGVAQDNEELIESATRLLETAKPELAEALKMLEAAKAEITDANEVVANIENIVQTIKDGVNINLADINIARYWLSVLGCGFVPEREQPTTGMLYVGYTKPRFVLVQPPEMLSMLSSSSGTTCHDEQQYTGLRLDNFMVLWNWVGVVPPIPIRERLAA